MRFWLAAILLVACEGPAGPRGTAGVDGQDGVKGDPGDIGDTGPQGEPGDPSPWLTRPAVDITVTSLTFDASGAHVAFTLADPDGKPLDRLGYKTEGRVTVSFALAQLGVHGDGSPAQYTAYTQRTVNAQPPYPANTATQATTEAVEANFEVIDLTQGSYRYSFNALLTGYDAARTQSVLAIATRTVGGVQSWDRDLFHVGSARREEVTDQTCGSCHGALHAHGGRYTKPDQCILCHTPQTSDPETGNTMDFRIMVHKIHRGSGLPSFVADPANPYQVVGFGNTVHDFSDVGFPGPTNNIHNNIRRCETCHAGQQGDRWKTRSNTGACTSCHDTTAFTANPTPPLVAHAGGTDPTLVNDNTCNVCHAPTSGVAPVPAAHYGGMVFDPVAPRVEIQLISMTDTAPGQIPRLRFRALVNGAPRNLVTDPISVISAIIGGPTTDVASVTPAARIHGGTTVGTLTPVDAADGLFDYTFPASHAIAANATGSFMVGVEANWTPAGGVRGVAESPTLSFAVTDPTVVPRRQIVSAERCNGCHVDFGFHGGGRKNANYCVMCHNPNNSNVLRVSRFEVPSTVLAEPVDFRVMIHKIHMGDQLTGPYVLGGNPMPSATNPAGSPHDFTQLRYPRPRTDCAACHVSQNWGLPMIASTQYLPSTATEMSCSEDPGADANNYCDNPFWAASQTFKLPPETSVCTSCHDAPYTAAHAVLNTTSGGVEACATCHGPGKQYDVAKYHGI
jgi:OmcA/MtrC family decaheme c-type cytochrome